MEGKKEKKFFYNTPPGPGEKGIIKKKNVPPGGRPLITRKGMPLIPGASCVLTSGPRWKGIHATVASSGAVTKEE